MVVNGAKNWYRTQTTAVSKLPLLASTESVDSTVGELNDLVAKLDFRQRAVLVLRYYGGWSEAEIAEALGCRPGTVKSSASRALAYLRKKLES